MVQERRSSTTWWNGIRHALLGLMGVGDLKTYYFQSIFVREEAMEFWAGGKQILEISCY